MAKPEKIAIQLVDPNSKLTIRKGVVLRGTKVLTVNDSDKLQRALKPKIVKKVSEDFAKVASAAVEPGPTKDEGTGEETNEKPADN